MKKIFFALAALAALASCSKSEAEYEQAGEIGFLPVTENMTKSMMEGTTFQTSEEFNLWSYYKPIAATSVDAWLASTSNSQPYIEEKPFKYNESNQKWGGKNNPYFWPKNGSLVFIGYYPTTIDGKVNHDIKTNVMTFSEIEQSRVADKGYSEDIMYFNLTPSYSNNDVAAKFKHALSWISLLLVKDSETSEDAIITVNKVEFSDVYAKGTGTVDGTADINWSVDYDSENNVNILEKGPVTIAKGNTKVEPYQPLFIPQTMVGKLTIEYEIKSKNDGSKFTEIMTIDLNTMKDSKGNSLSKWEPAKHYTYTITIGTSEILVKPEVVSWDEVSVPTTI